MLAVIIHVYRYAALEKRYQSASTSEAELRGRCETLAIEHKAAESQLRVLQERVSCLEAERADFDMQLELAVRQKEAQVADLRGALEVAYADIAKLEAGGSDITVTAALVKERMDKILDLEAKVGDLEARLAADSAQVEAAVRSAAARQQEEINHLTEGLTVITAELERMTEERGRLDDEMKLLRAAAAPAAGREEDGRRLSEAKLAEMEVRVAGLEKALRQSEYKVPNPYLLVMSPIPFSSVSCSF
jgi:chromosome segregation ATPase